MGKSGAGSVGMMVCCAYSVGMMVCCVCSVGMMESVV